MELKNVFLCFFVYLNLNAVMGASVNNSSRFNDMKLELVQTLFRHGERTVDKNEFQTYNYTGADAYKPWGFGQLTNNGKEGMYKIGQMLRQRYAEFLDENYKYNDVYAHSSEDDRTKMSLQLVLAGLYPPSPELIWNKNLNWIPLPTRYTPKKLDMLFKSTISSKFLALLDKVHSSAEYDKKMSEYSEVFDLIKNKMGITITTKDDTPLAHIFNIFHINQRLNIPLPNWCTLEVKKNLLDLIMFIMKTWSSTPELRRINGGPLIKTFLENMNVNNTVVNPRKIYLYSGHDLNIAAVTLSWGITDAFEYPDFGNGIIVEKWRDSEDRIYVRLLAYTTPDKDPRILKLKDCEDFCPIDDYVNIISDVFPSDEEMNYLNDDFNMAEINNLFIRDPAVRF